MSEMFTDRKDIISFFRQKSEKKLYLCGNAHAVLQFWQQFKDRLHIAGICFTPCRNGGEGWNDLFQYYQDKTTEVVFPQQLPGYSLSENPDLFRDGLIVICENGIYENEIEWVLDFYGYEYRKDYVFSFQLEAALTSKRILLLHGYFCFVRDLYLILREVPEFCEKYLPFSGVYEEKSGIAYRRGLNDLVHLCDVYIYNLESKPFFYRATETDTNCLRICIPCIYFEGIFPQISRQNAHRANGFYIHPPGPTLPYEFCDVEIDRMLENGMPYDQICAAVTSDEYFSSDKVRDSLRRSLRITRLYESRCDIHLADYIETHLQTERLFHCTEHWSDALAVECAKQIAGKLGVAGTNAMNHFSNQKKYSQIPVYPSVAKALGLQWVTPQTTYYLNWGNGPELSTFEEYVMRYCNVIDKMRKIKKIW